MAGPQLVRGQLGPATLAAVHAWQPGVRCGPWDGGLHAAADSHRLAPSDRHSPRDVAVSAWLRDTGVYVDAAAASRGVPVPAVQVAAALPDLDDDATVALLQGWWRTSSSTERAASQALADALDDRLLAVPSQMSRRLFGRGWWQALAAVTVGVAPAAAAARYGLGRLAGARLARHVTATTAAARHQLDRSGCGDEVALVVTGRSRLPVRTLAATWAPWCERVAVGRYAAVVGTRTPARAWPPDALDVGCRQLTRLPGPVASTFVRLYGDGAYGTVDAALQAAWALAA